MTQGNFTKYFVQALTPVMLRRLRLVAGWGNSPTFAKFSFYDIERQLRGQNVTMARRKSEKPTGTPQSGGKSGQPVQWLNYRLSPEDTAIVLSDSDDTPGLASRLSGLFASGADFSVRYVAERKNFSAFAIALARDDSGLRIGISAFGGTVWQAIAALLYKCDLYASEPEKLTASGQGVGIG